MVNENGLGLSNFELKSTTLFKGSKTFLGNNKEKLTAAKKIKRVKRMNFFSSPIEMADKKSCFKDPLAFLSIEADKRSVLLFST